MIYIVYFLMKILVLIGLVIVDIATSLAYTIWYFKFPEHLFSYGPHLYTARTKPRFSLRKMKNDYEIVLCGEENEPPYYKVQCTHYEYVTKYGAMLELFPTIFKADTWDCSRGMQEDCRDMRRKAEMEYWDKKDKDLEKRLEESLETEKGA